MSRWLLLHGFLGCRRDFAPMVAALGSRAVDAIDLPGHGDQPPPAAHTAFADGVAQIAGKIHEPAWLIGYSMGGRVALGLLAAHPQLVRGVVAIGANVGIADERQRQQRLIADCALADQLAAGDLRSFLDQWYGQPLFAPLRRQPRFAELLARRNRGDPNALAATLRTFSVGAQPDYRDTLARSRVPVLLIAGALDAKYSALNARLRDDIAGIQCRDVEGAGHCVPLEQPGALAEIIAAFAR